MINESSEKPTIIKMQCTLFLKKIKKSVQMCSIIVHDLPILWNQFMLCSPRGFTVQIHQVSGSIMWSLSSASRNPISKCSQRDLPLPTSYTTGHISAVSSVHKHSLKHWSTQKTLKNSENKPCFLASTTLHNSLNIAFMRETTPREDYVSTS